MKKNNLKEILIRYEWIIYFILFKPGIINSYELLNNIFNALMIILTAFFTYYYIFYIRKKNKIFLLLLIYFFTLLLSTIIKNTDIMYFLKTYLPYLGVCTYTLIIVDFSKKVAINKLSNFLISINTINLISIFIMPHDKNSLSDRNFFLGYDNNFVPTIVLGCFIVIFNSYYKYNKFDKKSIFNIIITIITCIIIQSSTAKVCLILIILHLICIKCKYKVLKKVLNSITSFIVSNILVISIVILRIQKKFEYIIVNVLHRDITFTGRIYIWNRAIEMFNNSPIIGAGVYDPEIRAKEFRVFHAHCNILNIAMEGGIISIISFLLLIFRVFSQLYNNRKNILSYILSSSFAIYFIITITEFYTKNPIFYLLIIIVSVLDKFVKEGVENEKNINNNIGNITSTSK